MEVSKSLVAETNTIESRQDLSCSYINFGDISQAEGKLEETIDWYLKAINICTEIAEETDTIESLDDLGTLCLNNLKLPKKIEKQEKISV